MGHTASALTALWSMSSTDTMLVDGDVGAPAPVADAPETPNAVALDAPAAPPDTAPTGAVEILAPTTGGGVCAAYGALGMATRVAASVCSCSMLGSVSVLA